MKSLKRGKSTSMPEVVDISEHGFWMLIKGKEYFLPFENFPWFRNAAVSQIFNFEMPNQFHIYWSCGSDNLADYFTKHHPASHNRALRPFYLHTANARFSSCEGVLITSSGIQELYELEDLAPSASSGDSHLKDSDSTLPMTRIPSQPHVHSGHSIPLG